MLVAKGYQLGPYLIGEGLHLGAGRQRNLHDATTIDLNATGVFTGQFDADRFPVDAEGVGFRILVLNTTAMSSIVMMVISSSGIPHLRLGTSPVHGYVPGSVD